MLALEVVSILVGVFAALGALGIGSFAYAMGFFDGESDERARSYDRDGDKYTGLRRALYEVGYRGAVAGVRRAKARRAERDGGFS